jgi:hypothetical protein
LLFHLPQSNRTLTTLTFRCWRAGISFAFRKGKNKAHFIGRQTSTCFGNASVCGTRRRFLWRNPWSVTKREVIYRVLPKLSPLSRSDAEWCASVPYWYCSLRKKDTQKIQMLFRAIALHILKYYYGHV